MPEPSTNWVVPTTADLSAVLMDSLKIQAGTIGASTTRITPLLAMMVERMRGAVRTGGRTAVSATAGSIPPEALFHVMLLTARALVDSIPQLSRVARITDDFTKMVYWSELWIGKVEKGLSVTPPTDPEDAPEGALMGGGPAWGSDTKIDFSTD